MQHRFGAFSLDTGTRQLMKGGREVHLSPKAFELLQLLVEHRARAVSKAEIQEQLWPSTFVGEANLATLVAEIRRALGESAQDARTIRTVHRFGYRFVAALDDMPPAAAGSSHHTTEMYLATSDRRYPLIEGAAVIGRARNATIQVDSGGVSRHHARIVVSGAVATIEDLGSKNGTFVDGHPITAARVLQDQCEIRVGPVAFTFRVATPTVPTETMIDDSR